MTKTAPTILAVIPTLPVIAARALLGATEASAVTCTADPCDPYVVTINQIGADVVATGSGEFDLTGFGLPFAQTGQTAALIIPSSANLFRSPNQSPWLGLSRGHRRARRWTRHRHRREQQHQTSGAIWGLFARPVRPISAI